MALETQGRGRDPGWGESRDAAWHQGQGHGPAWEQRQQPEPGPPMTGAQRALPSEGQVQGHASPAPLTGQAQH